jgi:hypothetical protein
LTPSILKYDIRLPTDHPFNSGIYWKRTATMHNADERPATGYDAHLHIRAASDLLPRLHAVARSRGLTAASFARQAVMEAVTAAEHRTAA